MNLEEAMLLALQGKLTETKSLSISDKKQEGRFSPDGENPEIRMKNYKSMLRKALGTDYEVTGKQGYRYYSGFIKNNKTGKCAYYSINQDWDGNDETDKILIRTAKDFKDYTGGSNHYTNLDNFATDISRLVENVSSKKEARSHKEDNERVAPRKDTEKVFGEIEDTPKRDRFTSKNGWGYKDAQASEENEKGISKDIEKYKTLKSFAKDARASAEAYNDTARHWDEKASELVKSKRKNEDKLLESITADDLDDIFTYLGEMQHYAENSYDQWVCIPSEVRDILDAQFIEGYSISYCLRWLQQALDDLIGDEDSVRADLENQLNENKKSLEERANFDKLDTVEYWAFCIGADLMRDEIFADGVGCDEAYEKAYELAKEFMNSEEFKDTTMSGYDALKVFLSNRGE